jgi:hypothetical protein
MTWRNTIVLLHHALIIPFIVDKAERRLDALINKASVLVLAS